MPQHADRNGHSQKRLAGAAGADAQREIAFAHGADIARLPIGPRADMAAAFHEREALRQSCLIALAHDFQDRAHVLGRQSPLMLQHFPQLGKDALGLGDALVRSFDLDDVTAGDDAHFQRIADQAQVLIAVAEKQHRLITAVQGQSQGRVAAHGRVNPK